MRTFNVKNDFAEVLRISEAALRTYKSFVDPQEVLSELYIIHQEEPINKLEIFRVAKSLHGQQLQTPISFNEMSKLKDRKESFHTCVKCGESKPANEFGVHNHGFK